MLVHPEYLRARVQAKARQQNGLSPATGPLALVVLVLASHWTLGYARSQHVSDTDPERIEPYQSSYHFYPVSTTTKRTTGVYRPTQTTTTASSVEGEEGPTFLSRQRFISVYKGSMAVLPCQVQHLGDRQVVWRKVETDEFLTIGRMVWSKDDRLVLEAERMPDNVTSWKLLLRNVRYSDAGLYECQVTSSEYLTWEMRLVVLEPMLTSKPKPRVHATMSPMATSRVQAGEHKFVSQVQEFVTAGLPIRLVCSTSLGNQTVPRSRLEWFKDGAIIQSTSRILLTRYQFESNRTYVSQLLIDQAHVEDSGKYVCKMMSRDLLIAKIFVNPRNSKNSPKREDRSQHYNVDTLQAENATVRPSTELASMTSCILVLSLVFRLVSLVAQGVLTRQVAKFPT